MSTPKHDQIGALIVEDDPVLAMSLADAMHNAGIENVVTMAQASRALAEIAAKAPRLLVLDVGLGDSDDGWGVAEIALQLINPPPKLVFATGSPDRIPEHLARAGTVFVKPYDPDEIARHSASLLAG